MEGRREPLVVALRVALVPIVREDVRRADPLRRGAREGPGLRGGLGLRGLRLRHRFGFRRRAVPDEVRGLDARALVLAFGLVDVGFAGLDFVGRRALRADLAVVGVGGGEFLGPDAAGEVVRALFEAEEEVVRGARRVVAPVGAVRRVLGVPALLLPVVAPAVVAEVHAAVQPQQEALGGAVGLDGERHVRAARHARDGDGVGVVLGVGVGDVVGVEVRVAVRAVLADHHDRIDDLAVLHDGDDARIRRDDAVVGVDEAVGIGRGEEAGGVGILPRPDGVGIVGEVDVAVLEVAAPGVVGGGALVDEVGHVHVGGVVVEVGVAGEVAADVGRLPPVPRGIEHEQHRRPASAAAALPGDEVAVLVRLHRDLVVAGEVLVRVQQRRDLLLAPLAEEVRPRPARERAAGAGERRGVVVAVRIDQAEAAVHEVVGVVERLAVHVVVVVGLRVHDAAGAAEIRAGAVVVEAPEVVRAEAPVQLVAETVVHQAHAGGDVGALRRRRTQVFAEEHRVVAAFVAVEHAGAVVSVVEAARAVELQLDVPHVAVEAAVVVLRAEEVVRHVLDGVQAQAVHAGPVHQPADRAAEVSADVLAVPVGVRGDVIHRQPVLRPEPDDVPVRVPVVELRIVRMPHEPRLVVPAAFRRAEILVGRLVGDVEQVREAQEHHLPLVIPAADVVPLAVEAVGGGAQVEILRTHPGVDVDGGGLVVAGHVVRPVVHHVVEVHAHPEPVAHLDQVVQVGFDAVAGAPGPAQVRVADVEGVVQVVPHAHPAVGLRRRRHPQGGVPGFRDFRETCRDLVVALVEHLQNGLRARRRSRAGQQHPRRQRQHRRSPSRTDMMPCLHATISCLSDRKPYPGPLYPYIYPI